MSPSQATYLDTSTTPIAANGRRTHQRRGRQCADLKTLGVKTMVNLTSDDAEPNERR